MKKITLYFFLAYVGLCCGHSDSGTEGTLEPYANELTANIEQFEGASESEGYYKKQQVQEYYTKESKKLEDEAKIVEQQLKEREELEKKQSQSSTEESSYTQMLKKRQAQINFLRSELEFARAGLQFDSPVKANRDNAASVLDSMGGSSAYTKRIVQENSQLFQSQFEQVPIPKIPQIVGKNPTSSEIKDFSDGVEQQTINIDVQLAAEQKKFKENEQNWDYPTKENSLQKQLDFLTKKEKLLLQAHDQVSKGLGDEMTNGVAAAKATQFSDQALSAAKERVKIMKQQVAREVGSLKQLTTKLAQRIQMPRQEVESNTTYIEQKFSADLGPDIDAVVKDEKTLREQLQQAIATLNKVNDNLAKIKETQLDASTRIGFNRQVKETFSSKDYDHIADELTTMKQVFKDVSQQVQQTIDKIDGINQRFLDPKGKYPTLQDKLKADYETTFGKGNDKKVYEQLFTKDVTERLNNQNVFSKKYIDSSQMKEKDFRKEVEAKPSILQVAFNTVMYVWKAHAKKDFSTEVKQLFNQATVSWNMLNTPVKRETYNRYLDGKANSLMFSNKVEYDKNVELKNNLQKQNNRLQTTINIIDEQQKMIVKFSTTSALYRDQLTG